MNIATIKVEEELDTSVRQHNEPETTIDIEDFNLKPETALILSMKSWSP